MPTFIDVCHTIHDGMITYNGLPAPKISDYLSREQSRSHYDSGTEFQIGSIQMVANTGTYLDSPFHRYVNGEDLADLELASLANLEGSVLRCSGSPERGITAQRIELLTRQNPTLSLEGKAVLFHTGWDRHWRTEKYWEGTHPFLTAEVAELLANREVRLVGIDSYNIDDIRDGQRPVHSILLARGIPIVEHLCGLNELPDSGFRFFAVPPKVKGFGSFPVRAFAIVG
ncbi:MAG TPA: cyclase family protein [Pyrinomonadaceae bacterium]|nr:cyclase family protein [Pyrinomonadaceae bacterium]